MSGLQVIPIEIDMESWIRNPAVTSRSDLLLIQGNKVIGNVRVVSGRSFPDSSGLYEFVCIQPDDAATKSFFSDDPHWINGWLYSMKYSGVDGEPYISDVVEEGRHKGTRVVDRFHFEFGICHQSFRDVEGFDSYHKRPKPANHIPQKRRKPRNSNRIKKVR